MIPIPFASPNALRSLIIYVDYGDPLYGDHGGINMRALVTFLSSNLVLEELSLTLLYANDISRLVLPVEKHINLDHVTELALTFEQCHSEFAKSVLDVVHFPFATTMELGIGSQYEPDSPDEGIHNVLFAIFPNPSVFPKLMDLHLDLAAGHWGDAGVASNFPAVPQPNESYTPFLEDEQHHSCADFGWEMFTCVAFTYPKGLQKA